ncbi:hypothetical protein PF011_g22185 [Phytophthora fragariae]|uniref:Uncharacterized protein n=1 Tax=Phytophthora fragariae TaxID=53985 RepID=A0A6A3IGC1_9STRA|nr:hypothetical protein PF011_g22185 [Phytophthora fragariae]
MIDCIGLARARQRKDNKLNFSLEDYSSKKQWFKDGMGKEDYVTTCTDNAISGASPADYLKYSHNALQRFSAHVEYAE